MALRAAAPAVAAHDQRVLLVRVGADGTIELVLSGPAELPAPWERAGTWWSLPPHVAVDDLAAAARTVGAPCVAVTTLGTDTGGCEVLVDIEALGVLSIDAGDRADDVARAIAVGLASSELAEVAHLVGVGLDADGGSSWLLGHRNASVVGTLDEAIELGTELIGTRSETRSRQHLRPPGAAQRRRGVGAGGRDRGVGPRRRGGRPGAGRRHRSPGPRARRGGSGARRAVDVGGPGDGMDAPAVGAVAHAGRGERRAGGRARRADRAD